MQNFVALPLLQIYYWPEGGVLLARIDVLSPFFSRVRHFIPWAQPPLLGLYNCLQCWGAAVTGRAADLGCDGERWLLEGLRSQKNGDSGEVTTVHNNNCQLAGTSASECAAHEEGSEQGWRWPVNLCEGCVSTNKPCSKI